MNQLLFSRVSIFDVLEHQQTSLKKEIAELESDSINNAPDEELASNIASRFKIEVPVLEDDKAFISHREVDVDVSRDPMRMIFDRSRPFYIKGTEITFTLPFKGDPGLFQVRPSAFNLNPPRGQVSGQEVRLVYTRIDDNAAAIKSEYQQSVEAIKQYLGWLENSIADFNGKIGQQTQALVLQRRQKLATTAEMISSLGLPVRDKQAATLVANPERVKIQRKRLNSSKKWDVFISHASEDKDELVRPLAKALANKGFSVWYDEFSLKLGDSLRSSIDFGLVNSRYGVVVMSKSFFGKHWPVQELNGLSGKEVKGKKVILPIWHKITRDEVEAVSPILVDRLAISSDVGVDRLVEEIAKVLEED